MAEPEKRVIGYHYTPDRDFQFRSVAEEFILDDGVRNDLYKKMANFITQSGVDLHRQSKMLQVPIEFMTVDDSELQEMIVDYRKYDNIVFPPREIEK